ncbi:biotin--[acetyl-CoA-carboxylase] ligase [Kordiimonas sp. SCSIO 12610]|uniref:biotin--[acetyl-CoA-carboxylase] ligase n=1 Tax=Kordiimonas sp. SCSIO 12610 TaxID=2829597 RepID=UPI00210BECD1|nr:biotin--[acetyl-CoA-carboxylase] ligase [Kordiimonas sp. SCSIO 12610]UTW54066.1 biotin--[acetyl-CoA-carboxylase] ligase [Kordiimonas sp. SCSIO 12610]
MTIEQFEDWTALAPGGVRVRFYQQCDSTNTVASQIAVNEPSEKALWITAKEQTSGRGRRGREWTSNAGNLYCSLLWRPALTLSDLTSLPFITALAVRDMFVSLGVDPTSVKCKWPNDILLSDKKASGILIESSAKSKGQLDYVVIGIGVNLMHFPCDAAFSATSLLEHSGAVRSVSEAFKVLADHVYTRLEAFDVSNPAHVYREWSEHSWGLGEEREIRTANEIFVGTPQSLADDGGLEVLKNDGNILRIYAGDVFPTNK